jgi:hypothetical protein
MSGLLCPLHIDGRSYSKRLVCIQEACAWFDNHNGCCAIFLLTTRLLDIETSIDRLREVIKDES